jgi:hypothetical protein
MHPAHTTFVTRPVFCNLEDMFNLLDQIDVRERHKMLASTIRDTLRIRRFQHPDPRATEEDNMEFVYSAFKEWCEKIAQQTHPSVVIFTVVSLTLMWLYAMSDDKLTEERIATNRAELDSLRERLVNGEMTQAQYEHAVGETEETINNLRAFVQEWRDLYESFCHNIVGRLPERKPTGIDQ